MKNKNKIEQILQLLNSLNNQVTALIASQTKINTTMLQELQDATNKI